MTNEGEQFYIHLNFKEWVGQVTLKWNDDGVYSVYNALSWNGMLKCYLTETTVLGIHGIPLDWNTLYWLWTNQSLILLLTAVLGT